MNHENKMGTKPMFPLIMSMAIPPIFSMFVSALYNLVDSIFVAQLSQDALTAVSIIAPLQNIIVAVGVGTGVGVNSFMSRSFGAKNITAAQKTVANGLFVCLFHSLIMVFLGFFIVRPFSAMYTTNEAILEMAVQYGQIILVFSFGIIFGNAMEKMIQSTGNMIIPTLVQLLGAVINLILDPIMIFGYFGFPALGVRGAAIATIIGQMTQMVVAFILLNRNELTRLRAETFKLDFGIIKEIYRIGIPAMLSLSLASVLNMVINGILAGLSAVGVAVMGILLKAQNFAFMPMYGLMQGIRPIAGFNYGARNAPRIKEALHIAIRVAVTFALVFSAAYLLFTRQIMTLFGAEEDLMSAGVAALRITTIGYIFAAVSTSFIAIFDSSGNGRLSMVISLSRQFFITLILSFILSKFWGLTGVWVSFVIAEVVACIIGAVTYTVWKRKDPVMTPQE